MTTSRPPLSVLDLSAFAAGRSAADALRETIHLAAHTEALGYHRYWLTEHHLNPGVAGSAPHVLLAAIAAATSHIRIGTAVTVLGNYTPLQVAEAAGTVAALHPGRYDLGIGRSGSRPAPRDDDAGSDAGEPGGGGRGPEPIPRREVDGLLLPPPPPRTGPVSDRFAAQARLLGRHTQDAEEFPDEVRTLLAFFDGTYVAPEGIALHAHPAEDADPEIWIHGTTAGPSARLAGELGLPFGANYHTLPAFVLDAVREYRASFVPGRIERPQVIVSADVVVAPTDEEARHHAAGYGRWVHSIRAGGGAVPFPDPHEAIANPLDDQERAVVQDRLDTQFVGAPKTVVGQLETLQRATGADELLITTLTHDPEARERSYRLLAEAWGA